MFRHLLLISLAASFGKGQLPSDWAQNWLSEDVGYIISGEERRAFTSLQTEEDRHTFVDQFWLRRDPTPDTPENEFEEEHYRRIAYANEHFASAIPGWKTDRGLVYIKYGPPDEIDSSYPFEVWRYRYIDKLRVNVNLRFIDNATTRQYTFAGNDDRERAAADPPDCAMILWESMSENSQKHICVSRNWLDRDVDYILSNPTQIEDLQAIVNSAGAPGGLVMQSETSFTRLTSNMTSVDLAFQLPPVPDANVDIYGIITATDREFNTRFSIQCSAAPACRTKLLLQPATYNLTVVARDKTTNTANRFDQLLVVPGVSH